jgi:VanZ family protein
MERSNSEPAAPRQPQPRARRSVWGHFASWLPAVIIAAGIFVLSSTPGERFPSVNIWGADKLVHGVLYGTLSVALAVPLSRLRPTNQTVRWVLVACFISVLYGVLDECNQAFIPFRCPSAADVIADGVGAFCGCLLFVKWRHRRARG